MGIIILIQIICQIYVTDCDKRHVKRGKSHIRRTVDSGPNVNRNHNGQLESYDRSSRPVVRLATKHEQKKKLYDQCLNLSASENNR